MCTIAMYTEVLVDRRMSCVMPHKELYYDIERKENYISIVYKAQYPNNTIKYYNKDNKIRELYKQHVCLQTCLLCSTF